jgi:hypothetical protein
MLPDWTLAPVMATTTHQRLVNPMVPCPGMAGFPGPGGDQCIWGAPLQEILSRPRNRTGPPRAVEQIPSRRPGVVLCVWE